MPLAIPNSADAGFAPQADPDAKDVDVLVAGFARTGVQSGCAVTAQGTPDMTLAVAAGVVEVAGITAAVTAGNVTITAANATNPRFDLVVASNSGTLSVTAGTAAASPVFPAIPANSVVLAAVYVPANDTAINTNQITDKRVMLWLPSSVVSVQTTDALFNTSTAENTIADLSLPGGIVAAGDLVRFSAMGDFLNNSGAGVTYTFRLKVGATTIGTTDAISIATATSRRKWRLACDIVLVSTTSQRVGMFLSLSIVGGATTWISAGNELTATGYGTAAEDTATAKAVQLTCQMGTSNALAEVVGKASTLEVIRKR